MNLTRTNTRNALTVTASNRSWLRTGISFLIVTPMLALSLTACETLSRQQQGQVIGGVVGGVVGSQVGGGRGQTAAIIFGSIAGSMIGGQIGKNMDDTDRYRTAQALNNGKTGQSVSWTNPDTGLAYNVTPTRTYNQDTGPCREFNLEATVGNGEQKDVFGTACLQADGSWKVQ